jgi:hypothetical protein
MAQDVMPIRLVELPKAFSALALTTSRHASILTQLKTHGITIF